MRTRTSNCNQAAYTRTHARMCTCIHAHICTHVYNVGMSARAHNRGHLIAAVLGSCGALVHRPDERLAWVRMVGVLHGDMVCLVMHPLHPLDTDARGARGGNTIGEHGSVSRIVIFFRPVHKQTPVRGAKVIYFSGTSSSNSAIHTFLASSRWFSSLRRFASLYWSLRSLISS